MQSAAIKVVDACKSFERGKPVLRDVNLSIAKGEMVALIRSFAYAETAAIIIIVVLSVMVIDMVSAQLRKMLV